MSAAGHSSPPSTSAAVLEFICLFTHDLRRKQKRWQDGRLKYHTFNNRVMVYDDRGNFVGDMHWRHDWDLVEGEEVQLERGGVIVQVQELSSRCEQDLSELLEKRAKDKELRQMQAVTRSTAPSALSRTAVRPVLTRPLHRVIGTPSGHHGRAFVPKESPFEQRHQASESPNHPAAKRRKYDASAPSKSGHASALFGQTLTLSATPMSSLPVVRRQPIQEPDSSPEDEIPTTRNAREDPKPPLREQSKVSRHFNQPSERQEPSKAAKKATKKQGDVDDDDDKSVRHQDKRSLARKDRIDRPREPTPVDVEVIDVDSLNTTSSMQESARQTREETGKAKQSETRKKANTKSTLSLSRHQLDNMSTEDDGIVSIPDQNMEYVEASKTITRVVKPKNSRAKIPKTVGKTTLAKSSATKRGDNPDAAAFKPREPNVPVTELRIKSRKKRGLMMMSDLHKTSRQQPCADSGVFDAASARFEAREAEETDCFSHSQPSLRRKDSYDVAHSREGKSRHQRAALTELREPEEPLRFSSLDAHAESEFEELDRNSKLSTRDDAAIQLAGDEDLFRPPTPPRARPGETANRNSELDGHNLTTKSIDNAVSPVNQLSPHVRAHDPYRLPSSSPEELVQLPTGVTSNLRAGNSINVKRAKNSVSPEDLDTLQSADTEMKIIDDAKMPKRQRAFLRNMILDEDDELDVRSDAQGWAEGDVIKPLNIGSDENNLNISNEQRRSKQGIEHRPRVLELSDEDGPGTDLSEFSSKNQAGPKHTRSTTKTKPLVQEEDLDPESEDELPVKRRRATRKPRGQTTKSKETSLPSEQEDSEEDRSSKGSRRKKPRTSNDRPRLEKVKKSVKSRELIGFNLSALNAPLGLRGIGMPFSVPSSPANESIQRKIDTHSGMGPSSESPLAAIQEEMPVSTSDALQAIAEADEMAVDVQEAEVDYSARSHQKMPVSLVAREYERNNGTEEPAATATAEIQQQPPVIGLVDATSPTLQQQTSTESKGAHTTSAKTKGLADRLVGEETSSLNNIATVNSCISLSKKVAASPHHQTKSSVPIPLVEEMSEGNEVEEMIEIEPVADRSLPTCKVPESKPNANLLLQSSRTPNVNPGSDGQDQDEEHVAHANPAAVSALPAFKRPTTKPTLPQQASCTVDVNVEVESHHNGNEETARKTAVDEATESFEESVRQTLLAGIRRQGPTFKPPIRAQVNTVHTDNESRVSSVPRDVNAVVTKSDVSMQSANVTRVLSRSNSDAMQPQEAKTTADSSDTRDSTLAGSELALSGRQPRVSLQRTVSGTRRINNINIKPPQHAMITNQTPAESSTKPAPNARIANPASRGRKAAVKSDAKGPVPQRMLPPTQPFGVGPISTADFASPPIEEPPKESQRPKKKMTFPGFHSAKGDGPWSREAFDLLESGRPG